MMDFCPGMSFGFNGRPTLRLIDDVALLFFATEDGGLSTSDALRLDLRARVLCVSSSSESAAAAWAFRSVEIFGYKWWYSFGIEKIFFANDKIFFSFNNRLGSLGKRSGMFKQSFSDVTPFPNKSTSNPLRQSLTVTDRLFFGMILFEFEAA